MINTISCAVNSGCFIGSHLDNEDSIFLAVLCCISQPPARRTAVQLVPRYRHATNNRDLPREKGECVEREGWMRRKRNREVARGGEYVSEKSCEFILAARERETLIITIRLLITSSQHSPYRSLY